MSILLLLNKLSELSVKPQNGTTLAFLLDASNLNGNLSLVPTHHEDILHHTPTKEKNTS